MSLKFLFVRIFLFLFGAKVFSKMLLQSQKSHAYKVFCKEVYGRDLCQANMVDEEQLQKLISIGQFQPTDRILDIGCGLGYMTEYLSDISGAHALGIDFAGEAIRSAQSRTLNKRDRIEFKKGNLNSLDLPHDSFDCIIAIDSLYFVSDLPKLILSLKSSLKPKGRILIFFSSRCLNISERDISSNKLGVALMNAGFKIQAWDFTRNEKNIWERTEVAAKMLKDEFQAERNIDLYKGRIAEAKRNLLWQNQGIMSRYLYSAELFSDRRLDSSPYL